MWNDKEADALANFGKALGISFQITDDLLDYVGSEEVLGKNIGDDFKEGKVTLPLIKAISKSSKEEKRFWEEVINKGMQKSSDLEHALLLMRQHNVFDETRSEAIKWSKKARNYLDIFPESKTKVILQELTYFVVERIT
jgi:octaprenyl-diphosphate synthase